MRDLGPLTDDYSLTSDWDNQWLTGGLEPDVIAEAHLDPASIFSGNCTFRASAKRRQARQRELLNEVKVGAWLERRRRHGNGREQNIRAVQLYGKSRAVTGTVSDDLKHVCQRATALPFARE